MNGPWHNRFYMVAGDNVGASLPARVAAAQTVPHEDRLSRSASSEVLPRGLGFSCLDRLFFLLFLALGLHLSAWAQGTPVVTFTLDFPGSEPSHYAISVSSEGRSTYDSDGKLSPDSEGDPFHLDFSMSSATRQRIFDLTERAQYFQGKVDSGKKGLASTGTKTLTYKDSGRNTAATYNYSPVASVQQLTQLFQSLSTTLEFGRRLQYFHHYQKLALDDELKRMEELANHNDLQEIEAVVPILQLIVSDQSVINPVRARAQRMIERAGSAKQ